MVHKTELAKMIQSQYDRLEEIIDYLEIEVFGRKTSHDDAESMCKSLSAIGFITIVDDNDNQPIQYENRLDTKEKIDLAKAIFYQHKITWLIMKGDYVQTIPLLNNAFGLTGCTLIEQTHFLEKSAKVRLNGTKGGKVHSKKKKDYPIVEEFWLKNRGKLTAKESATALEKTGLVKSTYGEILKIITEINKKLKNSSSQL